MDQYEIKQLSEEEFMPLWRTHSKEIFKDEQIFRFISHMDENDTKKYQYLKKNTGKPLMLNYCVFLKSELVGWSFGYQETGETFYMCNSAILPEHRRKGLYTQLINKVVEQVIDLGFQKIYSRHNLTNNIVIVPKLKAGFIISTVEISDIFGSLVHLTYYKNKIRNKMMDYRVGLIKPDDEIKELLDFK